MNLLLTPPRTGSTVTLEIFRQIFKFARRYHYMKVGDSIAHFKDAKWPIPDIENLVYIHRNIFDSVCSEVVRDCFPNSVENLDQLKIFLNSGSFLVRANDCMVNNVTKCYLPFHRWQNLQTKRWTLNYDDLIHDEIKFIKDISKITKVPGDNLEDFIDSSLSIIKKEKTKYKSQISLPNGTTKYEKINML